MRHAEERRLFAVGTTKGDSRQLAVRSLNQSVRALSLVSRGWHLARFAPAGVTGQRGAGSSSEALDEMTRVVRGWAASGKASPVGARNKSATREVSMENDSSFLHTQLSRERA